MSNFRPFGKRVIFTDHLNTEKVEARGDAARDGEGHLALVRDEAVDSPLLGRHGQTILVDLEPIEAGDGQVRRVRHLGTIQHLLVSRFRELLVPNTYRYAMTGPLWLGSTGSAESLGSAPARVWWNSAVTVAPAGVEMMVVETGVW